MSEILLQRLARVRTFVPDKWRYINPKIYSPYGLASIGYSAAAENTIVCDICAHAVTIDLENQLQSGELLSQIYNHLDDCIYRNEEMEGISKEELYLAIDDIYTAMDKEESKYNQKTFPVLNVEAIWSILDADPLTWKQVQLHFGLRKQSINIVFYLHFFGWVLHPEAVSCYFCGRTVPLESISCQSEQGQLQQSSEEGFDVVAQHRYFCLWKKQWGIYLQYLYDKHDQLVGYKSKATPLEAKKTRLEVDKYIAVFQSKTKDTFAKIVSVLSQCKSLNEKIMKDKEINSASVLNNSQMHQTRLRQQNQEIGALSREFQQAFGSLKRIKIN